MHLTPNMYKIVTLKTNAKEIITLKCMFDTKYVQNCITLKANAQKIGYFKMHLTPNMYKIITLKANAQEIITLKCI